MVSATNVDFYLHAFYRDNDNLKLFSTTKMKLEQGCKVAFIVGTCTDLQIESTLFSVSQAHVKARYDLNPKKRFNNRAGAVKSRCFNRFCSSHQQRYLQSSTQSQDDIDGKKRGH